VPQARAEAAEDRGAVLERFKEAGDPGGGGRAGGGDQGFQALEKTFAGFPPPSSAKSKIEALRNAKTKKV